MPTYLAADRARPWIVAFQAEALEEIAAALAAQPDPEAFEIRAADGAGAGTRDLTPDEREALREIVLTDRPPAAPGRSPGIDLGA